MQLHVAEIETPLGNLAFAATEGALLALEFPDGDDNQLARLAQRLGATRVIGTDPGDHAARLKAYFGGDLDAIDAIPVAPRGTAFQCAVWTALRRIRRGTTWSYRELAAAVGRPRAVRAVGAANGANPIALVLPCHRVIGADGSLTGYGGGLWRKQLLLDLERGEQTALALVPGQA